MLILDPMPKPILPPASQTLESNVVDSQPLQIPKGHTESLGSINDASPENWRYDPNKNQ